MNIIIGHTNMDLDCIASIVLAGKLYPDYKKVRSRLIHPVAKNLYNLMKKQIDFFTYKDVINEDIENIVVVDTRSMHRIKEFGPLLEKATGDIIVYDHHPSDSNDIVCKELNYSPCGANASYLGSLLLEKDIQLTADEATIGLTGIYADTGNFTHENITETDFTVANFFLKSKASIKLVKYFLENLKEEYQVSLLHEILNRITYKNLNGQQIMLSYMELEDQVSGLASVVEKIFEIENPEAFFAVFYIKKRKTTLIIARSKKDAIKLNTLLADFNGGGHEKAASAKVKDENGEEVYNQLIDLLSEKLENAHTASELMTKDVYCINEDEKMIDASIYLENINCTGAPVVNSENLLTGFLTLRDIMKARKSQQMHSPVKAYMSRKVITADTATPLSEIEKILYKNSIGHLPVMDNDEIAGIITRTDFLKFLYGEKFGLTAVNA